MKRRTDRILEKLNLNSNNNAKTETSSMTDTIKIKKKIREEQSMKNTEMLSYDKDSKKTCKENVEQSNTSTVNIGNVEDNLRKEDTASTHSSSIIENSPDRSIPFDLNILPLYNQISKQAHKNDDKSKDTRGTLASEKDQDSSPVKIHQHQSTRSRDSSSDSSSSSSSSSSSTSKSLSSSSSSSSSTSCHDNIKNSHAQINTILGEPLTIEEVKQASDKSLPASSTGVNQPLLTDAEESDVDLSDDDPTYSPKRSQPPLRRNSTSTSLSSSSDEVNVPENTKKPRKRQRDPSNWKQNIAKSLRNSGKAYFSNTTKKEVSARCIKDACKCNLKCSENINETDRIQLFQSYWALGDIEVQRAYIRTCIMEIKPKYKYTNAVRPRLPNNAFYFTIDGERIRICKTFFINTLSISDRQIRTVKKKTDSQGFLEKDKRGKHGVRKSVDPVLIEYIKAHINSIPRNESHYLRAATSREYISGEKTIMDLWKDFDKYQREKDKPTCEYWLYYEVFVNQFNIGFFQPKKDRCDLCEEYELAKPNRKEELKEKYDTHLKEKDMCRNEKRIDRQNVDDIHICAVYDLQAVMQCPCGETSSFFYKSKLNCLNFTIVKLSKKTNSNNTNKKRKMGATNQDSEEIGAYSEVYCYFWDETQGKRGANEIGSCILDYLQHLNEQNPNKTLHITFFSDNCCGQNKNKNKYITSLYSYAVTRFENIHSITHKYMIRGHTQNEGDNVHSLIEKEINKNKKSGPIYTPHQYVTLIKNARKSGKPFNVKELTHDFFLDLKLLQENWAYNFNEDEYKNNVALANVKVLKFKKEEAFHFFYKISYAQTEFTMINMRNKRKKMKTPSEVTTTKIYKERIVLSDHKKKDLRDLMNKNLIPHYYADFYNNIV